MDKPCGGIGISPGPSLSGLTGTENASNFIDIDVETALYELGGNRPSAPSSDVFTPAAGSNSGSASEGDMPEAGATLTDDPRDDGASASEVSAAKEAPSSESSDSDVIHIDLTQRPPPLPMSGLSLEQIVTMLPGTTYSVAGSGIPLRSSPRPEEPRQQPPNPKAKRPSMSAGDAQTPATAASDGGGPSSDLDNEEPDEQAGPQETTGPLPKRDSRSGAGAGGGGGSQRVAFTFVPGLGLVPFVIDDDGDNDDDEGEGDEGMEEDGEDGSPCAADGEDIDAVRSRAGAVPIVMEDSGGGDSGGDVQVDDDDLDACAEALAAAFSVNYVIGGEEGPSDAEPVEAAAAKPLASGTQGLVARGAAGPGGATGMEVDEPSAEHFGLDVPAVDEGPGSSGRNTELGLDLDAGEPLESDVPHTQRYDISEEQLRNIIQQAVHGLQFGELNLQPDALAEEDAGWEEDGDEDERVLVEVQKRLLHRDSEGEPEDEVRSPDGRLPPPAEDGSDPKGLAGGRPLEVVYVPEAAARATPGVSDELDEDEVEYGEDALQDDDGLGFGADEVDDSGSGAGDEPDSMLGGLRRLSHAADGGSVIGVSLDTGHARELASPGKSGAGPSASADVTLRVRPKLGTGTVLEPVRAQSGSDDLVSRLVPAPQPAVPGAQQLPPPRYGAYAVTRSYDAVQHGSFEEDDDAGGEDCVQAEAQGADQGSTEGAGARSGAGKAAALEGPAAPSSAADAASAPAFVISAAPSLASLGRSLSAGHASGDGGDLNSTIRTTGQSLSAIRQAALQAEAERQAKFMAERLGGGASRDAASVPKPGPAARPTGDRQRPHQHSSLPAVPSARPVSGSHITNPFGHAGLEASAAAGLIDVNLEADSSGSGLNRGSRRGSGSSFTTGYASAPRWPQQPKLHSTGEVGGDGDGDLEDLLRDRPIIEPRYPTDAKTAGPGQRDKQQQPHHHHQHDHHDHHDHRHQHRHHYRHDGQNGGTLQMTLSGAAGEEDRGEAGDGTGEDGGAADHSWKPRHRRSVELVDLEKLADGGKNDELPQSDSPTGVEQPGSGDTKSSSSPPARSLLATRKSEDGMLAPPASSWSPRMEEEVEEEEDGGHSGSSTSASSSAHSVADEHLVGELEAMREELGQKTTLVAGLRGELRKYTELAMRLEHQLGELRHQNGPDTAAKAVARNRSQSETGLCASPVRVSDALPSGPADSQPALPTPSTGQPPPQLPAATSSPSQQLELAALPADTQPPAAHGLPPHPQAQGLEGPARVTLYREILSQAQLHVGRSGAPTPPDLRDAQELLVGKERLDAGAEKVMLIKLQKLMTWGCEAAFKASVAQQQMRFLEQAAQQAAQKAAAAEAEQKRLKQELEAALAGAAAGANGTGQGAQQAQASGLVLQSQLEVAQGELAASRAQVTGLESAVASLNADVRKLKVQLRNSRDGMAHPASEPEQGRNGSEAAAAAASRADNMGWNIERQTLLKAITNLEKELEQASGAAPSGQRLRRSSGGSVGADDAGSPRSSDAVAKKAALADAALERVQQLQAERDAAVAEAVELRRQARTAAVSAGSGPGNDAAADVSPSPLPAAEVELLRQELAVMRKALDHATAEAESQAVMHEEECTVLRTQVVELRQELAAGAADAAAARGQVEAAQADHEALVDGLERQLAATEQDVRRLRADDDKAHGGSAFDAHERIAALEAELKEHTAEAGATIQALQQALRISTTDRDRIQQLLDSKGRDLAHAETKLSDVRAAVSQLQSEASELNAQVSQLQAVLARAQQERDEAANRAAAADERACDAHAASLLAETALGRALEEVEALTNRLGTLEDETEKADEEVVDLRARLQAAQAEAQESKAETEELRAHVAQLQAETRDLRTALAAEDSVQTQLRRQLECLEGELEAQASVAQMRGQRATEAEGEGLTAVVVAEKARKEAKAATQQALDAEARLAGVRLQLAGAVRRAEEATSRAGDLQQRLDVAVGQRQGLEQQLQEATEKLEAAQRSPATMEPRRRQMSPADPASPFDASKALAEARLGALEDQLRAAEVDREAIRREVSALLKQLGSSAQLQLATTTPPLLAVQQHPFPLPPASPGQAEDSGEAAALRAERVLLLSDCARLQSELEGLRTADVGGPSMATPPGWRMRTMAGAAAARAKAEALQEQLADSQDELQGVRAELKAARAELAAKGELLTAKDRALSTLQDTVEALRVALQVTQQNFLLPSSSPKSPGPFGPGGEGAFAADRQAAMQQYQDTVAALQGKFQDSETTIKRLEKQMAALETRLSPEDTHEAGQPASPVSAGERANVEDTSLPLLQQQPSGAETVIHGLRTQLEEKKDENARLLQDLEQARSQLLLVTRLPAGSPASSAAATTSTNSVLRMGVATEPAGAGALTVYDLQLQLLQWRALGEDIQARYQSKKETVRRLREQLVAEQQRHADDRARAKAQLEAALQRLGRLAAELGAALRRCIALDLQPLSASILTTSPRTQLGVGDASDDINALAAMLARQGAALIESLELALDHVTSAREERGLLLAQLAHRQVVLDELRHHIARQALATPPPTADVGAAVQGTGVVAGAVASPGAWPGQASLPAGAYTPSRPGDVRQTLSASIPAAGLGMSAVQTSPPVAAPEASPKATPATAAAVVSSPSKSLHMAAMNLAQDMAALSAQQAGLRSTLHNFEQRHAAAPSQLAHTKPRSLTSLPYAPASTAAGYPGMPAAGSVASLRVPPPRFGSGGIPVTGDALGLGAVSTAGWLSTGRPEVAAAVTGMQPLTRPLVVGLYQSQPASPGAGTAASPLYDTRLLSDGLQTSSYLPSSRGSSIGMGAGVGMAAGFASAGTALGGGAGSAAAVGFGGPGSGSGLSLSQERRLRLGEGAP